VIALIGTAALFLYNFNLFKGKSVRYLPISISLITWGWAVYVGVLTTENMLLSYINTFVLSLCVWYVLTLFSKRPLVGTPMNILIIQIGLLLFNGNYISFLHLFYFILLIRLHDSVANPFRSMINYLGAIIVYLIIKISEVYLGGAEYYENIYQITSNINVVITLKSLFLILYFVVLIGFTRSMESFTKTGQRAFWLETLSLYFYLILLKAHLPFSSINSDLLTSLFVIAWYFLKRNTVRNLIFPAILLLSLNLPNEYSVMIILMPLFSPWMYWGNLKKITSRFNVELGVLLTFLIPVLIMVFIKYKASPPQLISIFVFLYILFENSFTRIVWARRVEGIK
jgi:hypothetical protein